MDKKTACLLGAAATLATVSGAHAAVPAQANESAAATSYQDLLTPVPNAVAALKADDQRLNQTRTSGGTETAQIVVRPPFYHHHHHHHHHHHGYYHHHHHHHHHHHGYYRYYRY